MRKYGERGFVYGMQDCGHLVANIEIGAGQLGLSCATTYTPAPDLAARVGGPRESFRVCTVRIASDETRVSEPPAEDLIGLLAHRTSATGFLDAPVAPAVIEDVIRTALELERPIRPLCDVALSVGAATRADGWDIQHYDCHADAPGFLPSHPTDALSPVQLFMSQQFVGSAQSVILMSVPKTPLPKLLASNIRAGQLGQCFYISAIKHGLGICCVGGFDFEEARRSFELAQGLQPIYSMVLGHSTERRPKEDRVFQVKFREGPPQLSQPNEELLDA